MAKKSKKPEVKKITCTCCGAEKEETEFVPSASFQNRQTKRLSICKSCCIELYDRKLLTYQDEKLALYRFCMELDLPFVPSLVNSTIQKRTGAKRSLGEMYIAKLGLVQYRNKTFEDDIQFMNIFALNEDEIQNMMYMNAEQLKEEIKKENKQIITPEIIGRWGSGLEVEDYMFLEDRYNTMLNAYEDKNPANLWTYQELCMNYLYLRKNRGNPSAVKQIQEMISKLQADCKMKQSQIDSSEDENACLGIFIDKIENYEPCDKALPFFRDVDRIKMYIKRFFVQPFAREHGVPINTLPDMEGVEDYQDIDKIYKEQEEIARQMAEEDEEDE